jgi:predicted 3-demethylubiquinone-9 3-methyltransferase (glyoxalase superfamily)
MAHTIVPCLWFDKQAEEAAEFYAATFPDSRITSVNRAPDDYPSGQKGDVLTVEFTVLGMPFLGLNGGPAFRFSEAVSFQVLTANQQETDDYWNAIVNNGGEESACGWCRDKFGLSWQITPRLLMELTTHPDPRIAKAAFGAMMGMKKIVIDELEAAVEGVGGHAPA